MAENVKFSTRQLTKHLRELANETHDIDLDDGRVITKGEALARLLWGKALGETIKTIDDQGVTHEEIQKPASWAISMIYDRMEGKIPQSVADSEKGMSAAERVSELVKTRLNSEADAAVAVSEPGGHLDLPDNGAEGPEGPGEEPGVAGEDASDG